MQTPWSSVAFCTETAQRSWRCHCVLNALPWQSLCSLGAFSAPKSLYDKRYANNCDRKQTNYSKNEMRNLLFFLQCPTYVSKLDSCLSLCRSSSTKMLLTLFTSLLEEDDGGGPKGVEGFGSGHGWMKHDGQHGHYHRLMPDLRYEDPSSYVNYLRVAHTLFDELLDRLRHRITKQATQYRKGLEPGLKLAMIMRHLASGDRYTRMKFDFRVPHNAMSLCVREVCQAIIEEYKQDCIQCPTTKAEWMAISAEFERKWNVSYTCGALDGKHVACRRPRNSGSINMKPYAQRQMTK